jgi:hypothetical protein
MLYNKREVYYIVYIGRDNGYRTQFELRMKDGTMYLNGRSLPINEHDFINKLVAAEHTIGAAVPPECEYTPAIRGGEIVDKVTKGGVDYKSDWQCKYCGWRSKCWVAQLKESAQTGKKFYGRGEL